MQTGLFDAYAKDPLWSEARSEEALLAAQLVQSGHSASELIGTRAQVLACLYVQEWWRRRRARRPVESDEWEGFEVVEVEVVLSLDDEPDDSEDQAQSALLPPPPTAQPARAPGGIAQAATQPNAAAATSTAADGSAKESVVVRRDGEGDSAEKEMVVQRGVADVFTVVSDFLAYPKWVTGLQKVEVVESDAEGRPCVVEFTAGAMGLSISYTLAYTMEPPGLLSWRSVAGGVKSIVGQYRLTPMEGGSTKVLYRLDVDTGFKMPGLLRRTATKLVIGAALPDLKRYLESRRDLSAE